MKLDVPKAELAGFCHRNGIRRLSLFGSVLRGEAGLDSDVDLLVEFKPGTPVGLIRLAGLEIELSKLLGEKVDLRTPAELSRYFRDEVMASTKVLYAEG